MPLIQDINPKKHIILIATLKVDESVSKSKAMKFPSCTMTSANVSRHFFLSGIERHQQIFIINFREGKKKGEMKHKK